MLEVGAFEVGNTLINVLYAARSFRILSASYVAIEALAIDHMIAENEPCLSYLNETRTVFRCSLLELWYWLYAGVLSDKEKVCQVVDVRRSSVIVCRASLVGDHVFCADDLSILTVIPGVTVATGAMQSSTAVANELYLKLSLHGTYL